MGLGSHRGGGLINDGLDDSKLRTEPDLIHRAQAGNPPEFVSTALDLLVSFTKVGTLAWGGGPAMVPLMQAEVVDRHGWMTDAEFVDALAAGYALPGPIATKMSLYIGFHAGGWSGALAGFVGMVLPSALLIALVASVYRSFQDHPRVVGMLQMVRPVVLAMLLYLVIDLAPASMPTWQTAAVAAAALAGLWFLKLHPAWLIVIAAALGAIVHGSK